MTEEEILRKKLDWLNQNSHYGIMIDTEITKIVRNLIKRLEDNEMKKATSVQNIKDVKDVSFSIENDIVKMESKLTIVASTNDDIFAFEFEGPDLLQSCKATGLFTGWEKDQKIIELEKQLQQAENDKKKYEEKIKNLEHADMLDREAADNWSNEYYRLSIENEKLKKEFHSLKNLKKSNLPETPITDAMLVDDYLKLTKEIEKLTIEKAMLKDENEKLEKELGEWKKEASDCLRLRDEVRREKNKEINKLKQQLQQAEIDKRRLTYKLQENDKLKKELALEKAANEAQRKFIQSYAGKGTEVQFNYAIDDVKEVSYVIVDKEEYNKNFEKWANAQVENAPASTSRAYILDQAKKCVCGQREQDYGTPESNFQLIADLWNDYLKKERLGRSKTVVDAVDVSMMMALMKIARIKNGGGSGDSFVDLAGYAACGGEIWHGQKVKDQN